MSHTETPIIRLDGFQTSMDQTKWIVAYTTSGNITSAPLRVARRSGYSLTFSCPATGSPVGTVKLQACNDVERNQSADLADSNLVNWVDIASATSSVNSDSIITFEHSFPQYRWIRLVYTASSGTITATARLHTKDYQINI